MGCGGKPVVCKEGIGGAAGSDKMQYGALRSVAARLQGQGQMETSVPSAGDNTCRGTWGSRRLVAM